MPFPFPVVRIHGGQHRTKVPRGDRLGENEVGAFAESRSQAVDVPRGAEHNDGRLAVRVGVADSAGQLNSVNLLGTHANEHYIEALLFRPMPRLVGIIVREYSVS